jgi:hypothetical protein
MVICADNLLQRINDIKVDISLTESDHWPVTFTLDFELAKSTLKKIEWKRFKLDMSHKYRSSPEPIESISELQLRARQF